MPSSSIACPVLLLGWLSAPKRKRETPALSKTSSPSRWLVLGASIGLFLRSRCFVHGLLAASGATAIVLGIALQAVINDVFSGSR